MDACISKVGATSLLQSSGRSAFVNCMQNLVPPAKQEAFKNCISSAAVSDKLWTSEGRTTFIQTSVPNCVNQVA